VRTCSTCGTQFAARGGAAYCSSACRQKAYRQRLSSSAAEREAEREARRAALPDWMRPPDQWEPESEPPAEAAARVITLEHACYLQQAAEALLSLLKEAKPEGQVTVSYDELRAIAAGFAIANGSDPGTEPVPQLNGRGRPPGGWSWERLPTVT
jgi:hypothetical protein